MIPTGQDSLHTRSTLEVEGKTYAYYSLKKAGETLGDVSRLPFSMKVLLENLLRFEDGETVTRDDLQAMVDWLKERRINREIQYRPARVLMQDFTGVPAVVDLAAMRDAMAAARRRRRRRSIRWCRSTSSSTTASWSTSSAPRARSRRTSSSNMSATASATSSSSGAARRSTISRSCRRAPASATRSISSISRSASGPTRTQNGETLAYPDTLSAPTATRRWSTASACSAGASAGSRPRRRCSASRSACSSPKSSASASTGELREGITATDLVLTVTQMLRQKGVVGRFVEFYGPGLDNLPLADRATIANMAPEYGATCGFFPIDERTIDYLKLTGREEDADRAGPRLCRRRRACGATPSSPEPLFTDTLELDMSTIEPSLAGPKRPQDRVLLSEVDEQFNAELDDTYHKASDPRVAGRGRELRLRQWRRRDRRDHQLHQHVEPVGADRRRPRRPQGAREGPARAKPWVKTSLAPGQPGGDRLSQRERASARISTRSASTSSATAARPASAIRARCPSRSARRSTTMTWSPSASFPATAISKAASRPTAAPIISPRRRWWSPMR